MSEKEIIELYINATIIIVEAIAGCAAQIAFRKVYARSYSKGLNHLMHAHDWLKKSLAIEVNPEAVEEISFEIEGTHIRRKDA